MDPSPNSDQTGRYEITVTGPFIPQWQTWLADLAVTPAPTLVAGTTLLCGRLDQAALRALLCRLWDLNFTILLVRRVPEATASAARQEDSHE